MQIHKAFGRFRSALAAVAVLGAVTACSDQDGTDMLVPDVLQEDVVAQFQFSSLDAQVGEVVIAALSLDAPSTLGGVQGFIQFDASQLEFRGQVLDGQGTLAVFNDMEADSGELRFQSLNPYGLGSQVALVGFVVRGEGYARNVSFQAENVVALTGQEFEVRFDGPVRGADLQAAGDIRLMDTEDWIELLTPSLVPDAGALRTPLGSNRYGDATQDGIVNVLDNLYVANLSIGNAAVAECILTAGAAGNGANRDCVAANVFPFNLPGLGEASDTCAPGVDVCGQEGRTINVLDNLRISLESTGTPQDVVGDLIPKNPTTFAAADTLCFPGMGDYAAGTCQIGPDVVYTGTTTLQTGKLYVLPRVARFGDDGTQGTGSIQTASLVIPAGTRVEGADSSAIVITRAATIEANGTATQPIVFTCLADLPGGTRAPQCWGGIYIAGNAIVNEDNGAAPGPAPVIPGRNPAGGGNQRSAEGFLPASVFHGGSNDADDSGTLRYVVVAYGGRSVAPNNELNNLTLGSCGSGTVLEYIQVHAGSDDGLEIFGGRCDVRYLYATGNDDDNFDYSFGYDGDVQFVVVQQRGVGDKGFEVDNTETLATYNTLPRTNAQLWNFTMVGGNAVDAISRTAMNYRNGAGSTLENGLWIEYSTVFDVDQQASCDLLGTDLNFRGLVLSDVGATTSSSSCVGTELSNYVTTSGTIETRSYNPATDLKGPFEFLQPDFRPIGSGVPSTLAPAAPPAPFVTSANYWGAVRPVGVAGSTVPWYAGWTIGWQSATVR